MEFRRRKRGRSALELTPLIDVVFQLLVFFLLTASFVQPSLRLDLPSGEASDEPDSKPIMVEIDAAGTLRVDGDVVPRDGLEDAAVLLARAQLLVAQHKHAAFSPASWHY